MAQLSQVEQHEHEQFSVVQEELLHPPQLVAQSGQSLHESRVSHALQSLQSANVMSNGGWRQTSSVRWPRGNISRKSS